MGAILRWINGTRLYVALFTAPYAILWMNSPESGGWVMVAGHSLLVWYYALSLDAAFQAAELDPRLSLLPDRHHTADAPVEVARTIAGCGVAVSALFLVVAGEFRLALLIAAGGVGVSWLVQTALRGTAKRRFVLAEFVWSFAMLMAPALLIGAPGWALATTNEAGEFIETGAMTMRVVGATGLGALMMGAWALLCLRRDVGMDESVGLITTATLLGKQGTVVAIAMWTLGAVTLVAWGGSAGWWGWLPVVLVGWAAALTGWISAAGADRAAVIVWTTSMCALGVSLLVEVGSLQVMGG